MIKKHILHKVSDIVTILGGIMALGLASCSDEREVVPENEYITFIATVSESEEVSTRAVPTKPVSSSVYDVLPFYFNMELADGRQGMAVYEVAAGMEGQLIPRAGDSGLMWLDKNENHRFYGWTIPWAEDNYEPGGESRIPVSFLEETYENLGFDRDEWLNCAILERFIGASTPPLNYQSNGQYVEINFQHLVSKIYIEDVKVVAEDGSTNSDITATMTFYQLPQSAIFDRRPVGGGAPCVVQDPEAEKGVSCVIGQPTMMYICPGIDFSNMQFSIHIAGTDGTKGDYYGDFKSVIFNREDDTLGNWDEGKSRTVLYAGEMMTIHLTLRGGEVPGVRVNINDWNTRPSRTGTGRPRQGIYSSSELLDMYNKFADDYSQETVDEIFDLYGEEVDGEKVLYLYDDASLSHTRLPMAKELILDGAGHTVKINNVSTTIGGTKRDYIAHVGCCRNIFITNGTHIIYIDENFRIYTVDPDTLEMKDTGNVLNPAPLSDPATNPSGYNSYYIDYTTGEFRATTSH